MVNTYFYVIKFLTLRFVCFAFEIAFLIHGEVVALSVLSLDI